MHDRELASVPPNTVFAATKNLGKYAELRAIFAKRGWSVVLFDAYGDVDEGAESYRENAVLKARALHAQLHADGIDADVIGDDSGLEVFALDNRPGVLSARYGGDASWAQRRALLLAELGDSRDRRARFVCALHHIDSEGRETSVFAELQGEISTHERGDGGFSYDAIFCETADGPTFAEISEDEKNERSHRARAVALLVEAVRANEAKTGASGT